MKEESELKIFIYVLCFLLGITSSTIYFLIKQVENREATIKLVNEALISWRDEAYRLGYDNEWQGVEADSTDSGPYVIKTDQIKEGLCKLPAQYAYDGVEQFHYNCPDSENIRTDIWYGGDIIYQISAIKSQNKPFSTKSKNHTNYYVLEITDSIIAKHRELGDSILLKNQPNDSGK